MDESARLDDVVDWAIEQVGRRWVVGMPLGLGKPNALINAFYRRACADSSIDCEFVTALSLNPPIGSSDLEQRFLNGFSERQFGAGYPRLEYLDDLKNGALPTNVRVVEFYFQSGSRLGDDLSQRRYISSNYTHVARDLQDRGVNILLQAVARGEVNGEACLSLSSNPDVTLDLEHRLREAQQPCLMLAQHLPGLPFMHGDAVVPESFFDRVLPAPEIPQPLFALPKGSVATADYWIGLHASRLIRDAGTLQIGIGSLSDALVYALILRHKQNAAYRELIDGLPSVAPELGTEGPFERGLLGASEMFMDGFMHLYKAGILKRPAYEDQTLQALSDLNRLPECPNRALIEALHARGALSDRLDPTALGHWQAVGVLSPQLVIDGGELRCGDTTIENDLSQPEARSQLAQHGLNSQPLRGLLLEAAFFLGSREFYQWLLEMEDAERPRFQMTSVNRINQLYGGREMLEIAQRRHARFANTCMMMSVTGAACSDALADHRVVSGVGGQYNFVAMAHAMVEGRSILVLRAARGEVSNIVWEVPHTTIPRHLRDLVVTEYGIADLRGKTDEECIAAMICIADKRHQPGLIEQAVTKGKLSADFALPSWARNNTHAHLREALTDARSHGYFPDYPFGSDFTEVEQQLVKALQLLKSVSKSRVRLLRAVAESLITLQRHDDAIDRMGLSQPEDFKQKLTARLLNWALAKTSS